MNSCAGVWFKQLLSCLLFTLLVQAGTPDGTNRMNNRYLKPNWQYQSSYAHPQPEIVFDDLPTQFPADRQPSIQNTPVSFPSSSSQTDSQEPMSQGFENEYAVEKFVDSMMPYGIQNVRDLLQMNDRPLRMKPARDLRVTFQSLCPSRRETVYLNIQSEFEYRPNHYDEVYCANPFVGHHRDYGGHNNKVCGGVGFNCIQLNRTIFLTRKLVDTDCWESETRLIPAGCECMWPKHNLGDIGGHN